MRKAEEILAEAFEAHGLPELAAMYRAGHYREDHHCALTAIQQAQREVIEEVRVITEELMLTHGNEGAIGVLGVAGTRIGALLPHKE